MSYNLKVINFNGSFQVRLYSSLLGDSERSSFKAFPFGGVLPDFDSDEFFPLLDSIPDFTFESFSDPDRSLKESLRRSKQSIYYLARSNIWDYFVTLTFKPDPLLDRYDFKACSQALRIWLSNIRSRFCPDLVFLFVPEMHKDGAFHFHGLMNHCSGLPFSDSGLRDQSGRVIFNLPLWRYGFSTVTIVQDSDRCSSYLTKYITKDLCSVCDGRNRYRASRNINRAPIFDCHISLEQRDQIEYLLKSEFSFSCHVSNDFFDVSIFELDPEVSSKLSEKIALVE